MAYKVIFNTVISRILQGKSEIAWAYHARQQKVNLVHVYTTLDEKKSYFGACLLSSISTLQFHDFFTMREEMVLISIFYSAYCSVKLKFLSKKPKFFKGF